MPVWWRGVFLLWLGDYSPSDYTMRRLKTPAFCLGDWSRRLLFLVGRFGGGVSASGLLIGNHTFIFMGRKGWEAGGEDGIYKIRATDFGCFPYRSIKNKTF